MVSIEEYEELIRLENNQVYLSDSRFYMNFSYKRISEIELSEYNSKSLCSYAGTKLIKSYAGISFRHPNDCLRKNMKDEFVQLYELLLNKSLDELPAHNDQIVWRWNIGSIPPEGIKFLKRYVGKNIMVPQFWSTTKTKRYI